MTSETRRPPAPTTGRTWIRLSHSSVFASDSVIDGGAVTISAPDQAQQDPVRRAVVGHRGDILLRGAEQVADFGQRGGGLDVDLAVPEAGLVPLDAAYVLGLRRDVLV